mmetsp:Transcript_2880/g.8710  ORF Transcript_2880/g.8710 Transcript_2880/m.8710 type:complete len:484 (-) Transcript_2880:56-1507(-)
MLSRVLRTRPALPATLSSRSPATAITSSSSRAFASTVDVGALSDADLESTKKAILEEQKHRRSTLVIGAAGAVGKRLCAALAEAGHRVIASDRMKKLPGTLIDALGPQGTAVGSVDVTDADAVLNVMKDHADANTTVWNLAAPLSVETAMNPEIAQAVTVGGMKNVLDAMAAVGARRVCFTDSIGSFGSSSPRTGVAARWLCDNPTQDPGSDYGLQKRGCRELLDAFRKDHGGDPRFAVLPGVLHAEPVWGNGTTEYALDALLAAPHQSSRLGLPVGDAYICPVPPDVRLPFVFTDDLTRGLVALQEADEELLEEPERGYCLPGLSFSANELFAEIRRHHPGFGFRVGLDDNMARFSELWPDELATEEPLRDLGYKPETDLETMVRRVLRAHERRNELAAHDWKDMDVDGDGHITRADVERHIRKFLVLGREEFAHRGQEDVLKTVDRFMSEFDDQSETIPWDDFSDWNRSNSFESFVKKQSA